MTEVRKEIALDERVLFADLVKVLLNRAGGSLSIPADEFNRLHFLKLWVALTPKSCTLKLVNDPALDWATIAISDSDDPLPPKRLGP